MISEPLVSLLALISVANGYVLQCAKPVSPANWSSSSTPSPLLKRAGDPSNMEWIKRLAAIGDSHTAGIGAGRPLGHQISSDEVAFKVPMDLDQIRDNYSCSSGDRSEGVYLQAKALKGDLNFVTFTARGNDNIKQILEALNEKMSKDGILVSWDFAWFLPLGASYQALTVARRLTSNKLVPDINSAIRAAVNAAAEDSDIKYLVGYSDWDWWVTEEVDGQMCSPSSNGDYPDPRQPDMHFIKPDTHPFFGWQSQVGRDSPRKRELDFDMDLEEMLSSPRLSKSEKRQVKRVKAAMEVREDHLRRTMYDSILYKSPDPRATVRHKLDRRAPSPPGCPGDGGPDMTLGLVLPDHVGANVTDHLTIASFALAEPMDLRSIAFRVDAPYCTSVRDEFTCFSTTSSKYYVNGNRTNANYESFCKEVDEKHPSGTVNWSYSKLYDAGTPKEHDLIVSLANGNSVFHKDQCIDSMRAIINSCDTRDNPMNWKGDGRYIREAGDIRYEMHPRRSNRPWPPSKIVYGRCESWYKVLFGQYTIEGAGWATWNWGQKTMLPNMKGCYGLGTTDWKFEYYDDPGKHKG
ncbi:hypothetical protein BM1_06638 [Bipolaris maydis]|nr:hypothetical protein BM1_06638 [Bipolaris maydis]